MKKQSLPKGLSHEMIAEIISAHENQSEAEAAAEVDAAFADSRFSLLQVPIERIEEVRTLLALPQKANKGAESRKRYGS